MYRENLIHSPHRTSLPAFVATSRGVNYHLTCILVVHRQPRHPCCPRGRRRLCPSQRSGCRSLRVLRREPRRSQAASLRTCSLTKMSERNSSYVRCKSFAFGRLTLRECCPRYCGKEGNHLHKALHGVKCSSRTQAVTFYELEKYKDIVGRANVRGRKNVRRIRTRGPFIYGMTYGTYIPVNLEIFVVKIFSQSFKATEIISQKFLYNE